MSILKFADPRDVHAIFLLVDDEEAEVFGSALGLLRKLTGGILAMNVTLVPASKLFTATRSEFDRLLPDRVGPPTCIHLWLGPLEGWEGEAT